MSTTSWAIKIASDAPFPPPSAAQAGLAASVTSVHS
jgi:hypothetical protein